MLNHIIYSIISITYNALKKQVHRTCFCYLCAGDGDLPSRKRSGGSFLGKSGEAMLSPDRSDFGSKSLRLGPTWVQVPSRTKKAG